MTLSVAEAVQSRRSIKYFNPQHRLQAAEQLALEQALRLSPTAFNIQNGRYVWVRDPELRAAIRAAAWDQPQVTDSSALVVLCIDLRAWDRAPERYWANAPPAVADQMVREIRGFYAPDPVLQRDEGLRTCSIAAGALMLQARELGLDSCPMDGFDYARVGQIIALPQDHQICMMVAIGQAAQPPHDRPGLLPASETMLTDRFAESGLGD